MKKLYLIDGFGGSPEVNWLVDIENNYKDKFEIKMVHYSDSTVADVDQWERDLIRDITHPNDAYFICHSLGCVTFLRYLLHHPTQIGGAIFVSGFAEEIKDFPQFDHYMQGIEWDKIKNLLGTAFMMASRTDKIIHWQSTNRLSEKLEIPLILLPQGGHFTSGEGIIEMPSIKSLINAFWV